MDPRASSRYIAQHAQHVKVNKKAAESVAKNYIELGLHFWDWGNELTPIPGNSKNENVGEIPVHMSLKPREIVDWIFLVDLLNFNFWGYSTEERFMVEYREKKYTGYLTLLACIDRALDEGVPMLSPRYYSEICAGDLARIFRGSSGQIPMIEKRRSILHETGRTMMETFGIVSFSEIVELADHSAVNLVEILVRNFPSFNDVSQFRGKDVSFYKRAQIFAADLYTCFRGTSFGEFYDIERLTMFADYRVPQALVHLGVLTYSTSLMEKLDREESVDKETECEIRGCSIAAVDEICSMALSKVNERDRRFCIPIFIDYFLWHFAKDNEKSITAPIHKISTHFY